MRVRPVLACASLLSLAVLAAAPAPAVLIASGDGTGNTTAPLLDPGWSHVGGIGGLTGVYLGDGWVLTANHVGMNTFSLGGILYPPVPGSSVRLEHTPGVFTDLLLFRIVADPGLAPLPIATSTPAIAAPAILVGRGRNRGDPVTWSGKTGWAWLTSGAKRWGTNAVSGRNYDVNLNGQPLRVLSFSFDSGGSVDEAIASLGDSGGAAFVNGELAGILVAVWTYAFQPANTSLFGNGTYAGDLAYYSAQIAAITAERACGNGVDDDGDGAADDADAGCDAVDDAFETNALLPCDDGFDGDGDGLADWPDDPGCKTSYSLVENPACDDGLDNDGDGGIDWDGGPGGGTSDPHCNAGWRTTEAPRSCGLGFELALLAPLAARLLRLRRRGARG